MINPDTGELCAPGEEGEICLHTPNFMMGYLDDAQTAEFFVEQDHEGNGDKYCHTGDLGKYDEHGDLHYIDRMKEIIK